MCAAHGVFQGSISFAVSNLREGGFLTKDIDGYLHLTDTGKEIAEKVYERYSFFTDQLIAACVEQNTAEQEACREEHAISCESFEQVRKAYQQQKNNK